MKIFDKKIFKYFVIVLIFINLLYWIANKKGFFSDEIFSYGSSNYKYDNVFLGYDYNDTSEKKKPIWRTREEAKDYLTVGLSDIIRLDITYMNQVKDVHPPLFYILVHLVSIFFLGTFSKYIIFIINTVAFGLILYFLKKIFDYLEIKNYWLLILGFGISLGSVTLVIFQRMYGLMAMFMVIYTYFSLKIIKGDFEFDRLSNRKLGLTIFLGALTHYYFIIYVVLSFLFIQILLIYRKSKNAKKYFLTHLISGIIFLILFPAAVYHIFFSYRGMKSIGNEVKLLELFDLLTGFNKYLIILCGIVFLVFAIKKRKTFINYLIFVIAMFLFLIKFKSPYNDVRYIMTIFPILFVLSSVMINDIKFVKLRNILIILLIVVNAMCLFIKKPQYLFTEYPKFLEVANEYKDYNLVYVQDNWYNQIQSLEEFMVYKKTIILNTVSNEIERLKELPELKEAEKFVLSVNFYLNNEEIINLVKEYTEHYKVTELIKIPNNKNNYNNIYLFEKE